MHSRKGLTWLAAAATSLVVAGGAYAGPGNSPNGPAGPEGNPNQPAQAGGSPEQLPAKQQSAPNGNANGHAEAPGQRRADGAKPDSRGKAKGHAKKQGKTNHRNPDPGTPRKGGREDRPAGKITICHATASPTNPYVEITISVNGLNGHSHHHRKAGRWDDIIPAPAGGCPATVPTQTGTEQGGSQQTQTTTAQGVLGQQVSSPQPERVSDGPQSGVLGERASGGGAAPAGGVAGVSASGAAPADAAEPRRQTLGSLPFTGLELAFLVIAGLAALLGGAALRRALATRTS